MEQRTLTVSRPIVAVDELNFFRWGRIAGKVLVTNDAGDWVFLSENDFNDLLGGRVGETHPRFQLLQSKGFLRNGLDLDDFARRLARRNRHVAQGPHVHVVVVTERCNSNCLYCQASGHAVDKPIADMTPDTASKVVDLAFQSSSPSIIFEFQGGEPLLNFDVVRHLVEHARARKDKAGKTVSFNLLSNLVNMTEETAEWLIANDVHLGTTLDGPASLHDWNRRWKGGSAHAEVIRWIDYFHRRYHELGRDDRQWHVDALLTTTRRTLEAGREVVDEYVARGLRTIHLRPLSPASFARETWGTLGYTAEEYLDFYRKTLDYILELNRKGTDLLEHTASVFLTKILTSDDAGVVDVQSPCGCGTAQVVYNCDGRVFPCEEARAVDAMGDPIFELGHVSNLTISEVLRHPTVRTIAAASLLDAQPMCADCWNKPFCGVCPIFTYLTEGKLFGQRPRSFESKEHMYVSAKLFELLSDENDTQTRDLLKRWATDGPRLPGQARILKEAPGHPGV